MIRWLASLILHKMRSDAKPAWIVCRKLETFTADHDGTLLQWAERGRLRPDDYLVNPRLDVCVQARDVAEIMDVFRESKMRRLRRISSVLAWLVSRVESRKQKAEGLHLLLVHPGFL